MSDSPPADASPATGFSRRWLWFMAAVLGVVAIVALFVRYNPTPSVQTGLYLRAPEWMVPGEPGLDDLVMGCIPDGDAAYVAREREYLRADAFRCDSGIVPVLKRVRAVEGQVVTVAPDAVSIDGTKVGEGPRTLDRLERPLTPAYGRWVIEPGQVWAGSEVVLGFDSRYFGPIEPHARAWLLIPID